MLCYLVGKLYEDEFLIYKLYLKVKNIIFFRYNIYVYCIRENSIMIGFYNIKRLYVVEVFKERIYLLEKYLDLVF